jgi:cytochrome c-type protein NapB
MDGQDIQNYFASHRRLALTVGAIVAITAVSGYYMGLRQTRDFSAQAAANANPGSGDGAGNQPQAAAAGVKNIVEYWKLPEAGLQPNASWQNTLAKLPPAPASRDPLPPLDEDERAAAVAHRKSRRLYDGAPPTVPHAISQDNSASCLSCHGAANTLIAGKLAPKMSHQSLTNCTQCHVPQRGLSPEVLNPGLGLVSANAFAGFVSAGHGSRAYPAAPPTIPHSTWMRTDCMSCHRPGRVSAIRTSHPDRQSCTQCHAPSADLENRRVPDIGVPIQFPIGEAQPAAPSAPPPPTAAPAPNPNASPQ